MSKKYYKQYDPNWASLKFPCCGCTVGGSGCGLLALTNILIQCDKYVKATPKTFYSYFKQFSVYQSGKCYGTEWAGVPKAMEHFGMTEVKEYDTPDALWKAYEKDPDLAGIVIFGSDRGGYNRVVWSTSGHCIGFIGHRVKDGDHQLYTLDSGSRNHTGWYGYKSDMRGDMRKIWAGKLPKTETYTGSLPMPKYEVTYSTNMAEKIDAMAKNLAWAYGTPKKDYMKSTGTACPNFKAAWKKDFSDKKMNTGCHSYVRLVLKECGYDTMPIDKWDHIVDYFRSRKDEFKELTVDFTEAQLRAGDIRIHQNSHGGWHIWIMVDVNGKLMRAEALQGTKNDKWSHINSAMSGNLKKHKKDYLFRPLPRKTKKSKNTLEFGDRSSAVLKWKEFINWYFDKKVVKETTFFGKTCEKYTKLFKEQNGFKKGCNGKVGKDTITKAKKAVRAK